MNTFKHSYHTKNLLYLPDEVLVQGILSRLPLSTLVSCLSTCRDLHSLIQASVLLTYLKELEIAGLIDNPDASYSLCPLNDRLDMLRERELRWRNLDSKWRKSGDVPPFTSGDKHDASGGVYLLGKCTEFDEEITIGINSTRLSSDENAEIEWEEISFGETQIICIEAAIEEHDLLVCATTAPSPIDANLLEIHFLQYSTRLPHPLASVPILRVSLRPYSGEAIETRVNLSVCGRNLAIVVYAFNLWSSSLIVFNWTTGTKRGEFLIKEPRLCLSFLREDVIVNASLTNPSLDIYHIRVSDKHEIGSIDLVAKFYLPRIRDDYELLSVTCDSKPKPISTSSCRRTSAPFISDPSTAILVFGFYFRQVAPGWGSDNSFTLITHRQTLLDHVLAMLPAQSPTEQDFDNLEPTEILWSQWGPKGTRFFECDEVDDSTGTRRFSLKLPNGIEVFDFGSLKVAFERARQVTGNTESRTNTRPDLQVELVDMDRPHVYIGGTSIFGETVSTHLPYIRSAIKGNLGIPAGEEAENREWDGVLLDDDRVVGLNFHLTNGLPLINRLDSVYFG